MLRETVLHDVHVALGAKMVEFGGWHMPVLYSSIREEHRAVRTAAGLFDLSHMGRVEVSGPAKVELVEYIQTQKVADAQIGEARYALLCDERGLTLDDIVFYRFEHRILVVVNASNRDADVAWMQRHLREPRRFEAGIDDRSESLAMLAIQGPKSVAIASRLTKDSIARLGYYRALEGTFAGAPAVIGRTGYTGEDGFELYFAREHAVRIWNEILEAGRPDGMLPIGLGARDTLRLEAAMPLYGHELTPETNPLEAGLGFAVKLKRGEFVGQTALQAIGKPLARRLVCIECDGKKIPREGHPVIEAPGGAPIGKVTSGTFSPTLERPICMAYVASARAEVGTPLAIDVRGDALAGRVVKRPFYKRKD